MKLFGNNKDKELEPEDTYEYMSEARITPIESQDPGNLVLKIEGLEDIQDVDEEIVPEFKTDLVDLPEVKEEQDDSLLDQLHAALSEAVNNSFSSEEPEEAEHPEEPAPAEEAPAVREPEVSEPEETEPMVPEEIIEEAAAEPEPETAAEDIGEAISEIKENETAENAAEDVLDDGSEMTRTFIPVFENADPEGPAEAEPAMDRSLYHSVSYESMAEAVETAQKEPTGRFSRDAIDDETLLSELRALIGDSDRKDIPEAISTEEELPEQPAEQLPTPGRITPEMIRAVEDEIEEEEAEEEESGAPGWLKGVFLLLLSLLLSAMTFYAVATDLIGEIF